jgi:hypothetical protein
MLNNRRRFVISAAVAAVLVLLAGGANALAAATVRCVTKTSASPNPNCTAAATYPTISLAVAAAVGGDIIVVGPGTYNESVTISIPIFLFGAQAGKDARYGRHDPTKESIVDAGGQGNGDAFFVMGNYVVIDGFTIQGGTNGICAAGIYWNGGEFTQILNNIIQNNAAGVYQRLPSSTSTLIEHNLFKTNNEGTAGPLDLPVKGAGYGIVGGLSSGVAITENAFTGNKTAAMYIYSGVNGGAITKNTSENDGSFVIFDNCQHTQFSHNQGKNFGALGPGAITADAAIEIGHGSGNLEISDNDLEEGKAPISNGIAFTTTLGGSPSGYCKVNNNRIKRFPGNGIVAETLSGAGTVYNSSISGNEVQDNGLHGIFIEGATTNNTNIGLFDNEAEGNHVLDCNDTSTGNGTLATGNTWFNSTGNSSSPTGLCTPGRGHDHDVR